MVTDSQKSGEPDSATWLAPSPMEQAPGRRYWRVISPGFPGTLAIHDVVAMLPFFLLFETKTFTQTVSSHAAKGPLEIEGFYFFHNPWSDRQTIQKKEKVFKNTRPARPQQLGRAERTEEYVSAAKWRERRWRHFSTLSLLT